MAGLRHMMVRGVGGPDGGGPDDGPSCFVETSGADSRLAEAGSLLGWVTASLTMGATSVGGSL